MLSDILQGSFHGGVPNFSDSVLPLRNAPRPGSFSADLSNLAKASQMSNFKLRTVEIKMKTTFWIKSLLPGKCHCVKVSSVRWRHRFSLQAGDGTGTSLGFQARCVRLSHLGNYSAVFTKLWNMPFPCHCTK